MQLQMFKNTKYVHFWEPTQPCEGLDGDWHMFPGNGTGKELLGMQALLLSALHTLSTGRALKMQ